MQRLLEAAFSSSLPRSVCSVKPFVPEILVQNYTVAMAGAWLTLDGTHDARTAVWCPLEDLKVHLAHCRRPTLSRTSGPPRRGPCPCGTCTEWHLHPRDLSASFSTPEAKVRLSDSQARFACALKSFSKFDLTQAQDEQVDSLCSHPVKRGHEALLALPAPRGHVVKSEPTPSQGLEDQAQVKSEPTPSQGAVAHHWKWSTSEDSEAHGGREPIVEDPMPIWRLPSAGTDDSWAKVLRDDYTTPPPKVPRLVQEASRTGTFPLPRSLRSAFDAGPSNAPQPNDTAVTGQSNDVGSAQGSQDQAVTAVTTISTSDYDFRQCLQRFNSDSSATTSWLSRESLPADESLPHESQSGDTFTVFPQY